MAINKVIVIGNLGANPEVRCLPSGQHVANFSLVTTERLLGEDAAGLSPTNITRLTAC